MWWYLEELQLKGKSRQWLKKSYLAAAECIFWILKETQAWGSTYLPHRAVVKSKGKMEVTNLWVSGQHDLVVENPVHGRGLELNDP